MTDHKDINGVDQLSRIQTAQSVNISMEMFEKLYLNPENRVRGHLRSTFANPTPLPLLGFLIASTPLACALMGWRGAGGGGAATVGTYYFFGGMLQIIGALLEWVIGNTFIYIVFGSFGAFWLAFGATLTPYFNAEGAFTSGATTTAEMEAGVQSFQASLGFFLLFMGVLVFMYLICSLRTNAVFFMIFLCLDMSLFLLTAAYWKGAEGDTAAFERLEVAAGAFVFAFCMFGWYLFFAQLLRAVDFPLDLPVGDLSGLIKARKAKPDIEKNVEPKSD
ncbi:unnamed protein product [Zymoseptoria tritici ST99CH_1A5]|uniref:GPR1/FUN34/YaaH-class plasma membrane protein n=4 Tax=Zymoseptoria tritici TaxID=1047171 RepID=F9XDU5_ZYMTI|nr:uncharacterized protein MYCGRDRAFT_73369 [Zymoseptoria tritici IPO323]SMQ51904.1 unnamed protein product [Zymoseptoria tritici ST99CH_3D7]SMR54402.1 unnamed protein product [Zymoseptoria tritici ST99CH_1E4]SMR56363.1 unnamed protein product [Zymoseptoria tritici ST99CH_3D1]SMY25548.1 unnamed protein product [Zymoseptoria tritici ST99CH_1A5]EGP86739.1 hypothetical protein MYCGRDRAFT_73369 [Zymoseptoria tritici IPO323]